MPFNSLSNSTFLDAFGANLSTAAQYAAVAGGSVSPLIDLFRAPGWTVTAASAPSSATITVGLVLDRAADPNSLLAGNWAQREADLGKFPTSAALWSKYGANADLYNAVQSAVTGAVSSVPQQTATGFGYLSSAADRTIWLSLSPAQFQKLFGQSLQQLTTTVPGATPTTMLVWTGNLGLDS